MTLLVILEEDAKCFIFQPLKWDHLKLFFSAHHSNMSRKRRGFICSDNIIKREKSLLLKTVKFFFFLTVYRRNFSFIAQSVSSVTLKMP